MDDPNFTLLCLAWQQEQHLYLGADSRLSLADTPPIDTCAKIVRVPVSIRILGEIGKTECLTLGLAFAGSFITAYTVREILLELLSRFQAVPGRVSPSMETLARVVATVFETVGRQVCGSVFEQGTAELLVGGYCLEHQRIRLFRITSEVQCELVFRTTEIDVSQPIFIGSGAKLAHRLAKDREAREMPFILRDVIRDESEPKVGGPMQFGKFAGRDFTIFGVQEVEESSEEVAVRYVFRGVKARGLLEQVGLSFAHFESQFLAPFNDEIDDAADRGKLVKPEY